MCSSMTLSVSLKTRLSCGTFRGPSRAIAGDALPVMPGELCETECSDIVGMECDADEVSSVSFGGSVVVVVVDSGG